MITHLKLAYNALATLPENIGLMENLVHLDVSHNRLKSLPTSIGSLAKLSVLQARNNCLEELPQEIGQLSALSALDISQNDISFLPAEVVRLGNLCRLITTRCPFMDTAPSIRPHNPCSLREACARTIIRHHIPLQDDLPVHIRNYVLSAKECSVCAQPCYERIIYRYKLHDRGSGQTIPLRYTLCSAHWNDHDESLSSMFSTRSTHSLQHYMKDSSINTQLVPVEPASTNHRASIVRPMPIQSPQRKNTLWHKARMRLLNHDIVA
jgi:Leucine-rich repeat (LRR) protein